MRDNNFKMMLEYVGNQKKRQISMSKTCSDFLFSKVSIRSFFTVKKSLNANSGSVIWVL